MARATARVMPWLMDGGLGAGPSGMGAAKKKAALKQREEKMPTPLSIPPWDKWGRIFSPPSYHLSLDYFQVEKAGRKILMDGQMKK